MACNHTYNCGCKDSYLTTPPPCPTPVDCELQQPCAEIFDAQCIKYFGVDITCNDTTVVATSTSVQAALENIVAYFCALTDGLVTVNAGPGVNVTETVVNNQTTYTISSTTPGLYAQIENSATVADPATATIIGTGVGTLDVPEDSFQVGDSFRVKMAGHITCSNTQELTISIFADSTQIASTGIIDLKNATNAHWLMEIDFTIRITGGIGVGEIVSAGNFSYIPDAAGQAFEGSDFSVVSNLDTTAFNTLDIRASWNLDEGGTNTIYSELFTLTKIY